MRICALDLSKRSTGWAAWGAGDVRAGSGTWELGSEFTPDGLVYCRLHEQLTALHSLGPIDAVFWEEPLDPRKLSGHTNIDTLRVLSGLAAHAASWAEAMGCRVARSANQVTWRRHFLGPLKRGTRSADLKALAMERCRQLGFKPQKHDQAEAIGILDFACDQLSLTPPWAAQEVLRPMLGVPA